MDRRIFFQRIVKGESAEALHITSGLEPYKPNEKLSKDDALHLLGRTTFGASYADLSRAVGMTTTEAVASLLSSQASPTPPAWTSIDPDNENFSDPLVRQSTYYQRSYELQNWWASLMRGSSFSIVEKMTLFWHSILCSDYVKVYVPQYMYVQNQSFRSHALGNVKALIRAMVSDPAMLVYLDNLYSIKGNPNENFARELMELFTLGVNNYSERDIVEAARALTGWRIKGLKGEFHPEYWDPTSKTFMSKTGAFKADEIVDTIFDQDACARYYARRLYKFFVYDVPDETVVTQLASLLKQNNYEIKPVLSALLGSAHFFDLQVRGALVKGPMSFICGMSRQLNYNAIPQQYLVTVGTSMNQEILYPPNVEGWKGAHLWLNTNLYPLRQRIAESVVESKRQDTNVAFSSKLDVVAFASQFSSVAVATDFVKDVARLLLAIEPGPKEQDLLLEALLQGAKEYEWKLSMPNVEFRLRELLKAVMTLPEYQLL